MGLPEGGGTDPKHSELTNSQQITALGNGVLPLRAAMAIDSTDIDSTDICARRTYGIVHRLT
jgi:hypothetical protein